MVTRHDGYVHIQWEARGVSGRVRANGSRTDMGPLVIAHRGASGDAPENTLEAFRLAVEQHSDMIETDLHLTRDRQVVLRHDPEIGCARIDCLSLAEVRERAPEVPTLETALDAVGERVEFNLEIKRGPEGAYRGLAEVALRAVRERSRLDRTLWSSFFEEPLEEIRMLEPRARLGLLVALPELVVTVARRGRVLGAEAIHPERRLVTRELVRELHAAGYRVHVYTVDERSDQERMIAWQVDGIFTNVPARLRALLPR